MRAVTRPSQITIVLVVLLTSCADTNVGQQSDGNSNGSSEPGIAGEWSGPGGKTTTITFLLDNQGHAVMQGIDTEEAVGVEGRYEFDPQEGTVSLMFDLPNLTGIDAPNTIAVSLDGRLMSHDKLFLKWGSTYQSLGFDGENGDKSGLGVVFTRK